MRSAPPAIVMLAALALCALAGTLATGFILSQPWLGLTLTSDDIRGAVRVAAVAPDGPARAAAPGMTLRAIEAGGTRLPLEPADLLEEPDILESYADLARFMARQGALAAALAAPQVVLHLSAEDGTPSSLAVRPGERPLATLSPTYWVQLVAGAGSLLISLWVWVLRRSDASARLFALTGLFLCSSAFAAAVYSARELALPGTAFRLLSALNHIGALGFGVAMIGLFLVYPRVLVAPRRLPWLALLVLPTLALDLSWQGPGTVVFHATILCEMAAIVALIGVQWWKTRGDPAARAALRWLGLSVIIGAGSFITLVALPAMLGAPPLVSQGYAFGFFLLIYTGLALGLRRYRLFELDEWAFRVAFYAGAAALLVAVDAALILALPLEREPALGLALLSVAFLYLPLRDLLWRRFVARRSMSQSELFGAVVTAVFAATPAERQARWKELLHALFDPLEISHTPEAGAEPALRQEGLAMELPAFAGTPGGLLLRHPFGGRALFGPAHLDLARQIARLAERAEASRAAYDRGVREERRRIAQDLHDDVGARLLSGLHRADAEHARATLREAIADIRTIVSGMNGEPVPAAEIASDLRYETVQRLEAAGIAADWPPEALPVGEALLDYRAAKSLVSAHREIISNVIRHAGAAHVAVELRLARGELRLRVSDDGRGLPAVGEGGGNGLRNLARRMADLGGALAFPPAERGTTVELSLPLAEPPARHEAAPLRPALSGEPL